MATMKPQLYEPLHDINALLAACTASAHKQPKKWRAQNDAVMDGCKANEDHATAIDAAARASGKDLYRIIWTHVADGLAAYQIIGVRGNKVNLKHLTGFGDDYRDLVLMDGGWIERSRIEIFLR